MLGRTRAEMRDTLGADEYDDWLLLHGECDLPDSWMVVGVLGSLFQGKPGDYAPYYREFERSRGSLSLANAVEFARAYVASRPKP